MQSITRITVTLQATQAVAWPHFAGSALRGAFGRALRRAACITGKSTCTGCPLRNNCAYGVVFDPAAHAQPLHPSFRDGLPRYLIQAPALGACSLATGQNQSFDLLLLPGTYAHHSFIEHTLRRMVEQELMEAGLFKMIGMQSSEHHLAKLDHTQKAPAAPHNDDNTAHITLRWLTPLRLQHQGKPVFKPQQLDAPTLLRALLRRHLQWCQIADQPAPDMQTQTASASACTLDTRQLQWHDIQRHSGTQNQKIPLGGLIGSATLSGPSAALHGMMPLLQLGEQIHIGKETVMGLGRYQLSAAQTD